MDDPGNDDLAAGARSGRLRPFGPPAAAAVTLAAVAALLVAVTLPSGTDGSGEPGEGEIVRHAACTGAPPPYGGPPFHINDVSPWPEDRREFQVFESATGTHCWTYRVGHGDESAGTWLGAGRMAVVLRSQPGPGAEGPRPWLRVFDLASAEPLFERPLDITWGSEGRWDFEALLLADRYLELTGGRVRAFDYTGAPLWTYQPDAACPPSPYAREAGGGVVLVAAECSAESGAEAEGLVLAGVDAATGAELWRRAFAEPTGSFGALNGAPGAPADPGAGPVESYAFADSGPGTAPPAGGSYALEAPVNRLLVYPAPPEGGGPRRWVAVDVLTGAEEDLARLAGERGRAVVAGGAVCAAHAPEWSCVVPATGERWAVRPEPGPGALAASLCPRADPEGRGCSPTAFDLPTPAGTVAD
ncbi:PQQ-binding-like beta-propeller repeat protein [Allonocardiopsis opalescens]|uniref:Putative pyrroloquinoline-quinone binding quinoprotein n=1 Tax=Allonocardiopsis opalescens TaxID=1144618 RepID=A0A2T0PZW9_9ACTN|nr:PQQ-binding-like beta-propeller repeat protein [Allonocardiopsis opalescens]PRX97066.1 putative pyrroloquinoline-quinone binding quinoprotein [Allonocardiopsis opalescens]